MREGERMKVGDGERERTTLQLYCSLFVSIVYYSFCIVYSISFPYCFSIVLFSPIVVKFFIVFVYCFVLYFYICFYSFYCY